MGDREFLKNYKSDEGNKAPYWYQIKNIIIDTIKKEILKPGELIPSMDNLCEIFEVSKAVIRQVLMELKNEVYIFIKKVIGAFISGKKLDVNVAQNLVQDRIHLC